MALLEVHQVSHWFGGLQALRDVSLHADQEILGLIGPNGAGKTTLFNIISGFITPTEGAVIYRGKTINKIPPYNIVRLGIARTFQIVKPFTTLTVEENILAGLGMPYYPQIKGLVTLYRTPANQKAVSDLIELCGLQKYREALANRLPIGIQRRLEIARALATKPKLLLLDEPAAGLVAQEAHELANLIKELFQQGIQIVLIEHNMRFAMNLCHRIVVLAQGEIIAQGPPLEIQANDKVINAYLGQE
ncbi:MAG: ABC transporter ATP-binding protein [Anaerolineales bacterium]